MEVNKPRTLEEAQHEDFIWTWKSNARGTKASIWLPYFAGAEKMPRSKQWLISYNGGSLLADLSKIDFIMFYGATGDIPLPFLDALSQNGILLMLHRRNQTHPYVFYPTGFSDQFDLLSRQILIRSHGQKRAYIARTFIKARFDRMTDLIEISSERYAALRKAQSVTGVRQIEANVTARFWDRWFGSLNVEATRRGDGAVQAALDAGSKFLYGVILRWVLLHKLSPCHGFLHEPTGYPSLVYDLMEPFRYIIEQSVAAVFPKIGEDEKQLVAASLNQLKIELDRIVYVPATRQYVRRKNLLHGAVLALRSYLLGETTRFVLPAEGEKKGGRPPKVSYKLPGATKIAKT